MLLFPTLHKVICECVLSFKLLTASRTYKHHISSLTFYIYYIIFFYKNQERFFKAVFGPVDRKPASCAITPKVRRAHRTTHYRMAAFKPTFEVFRDLPLGSIQENSYFGCPSWTRTNKTRVRAERFTISLRGNIYQLGVPHFYRPICWVRRLVRRWLGWMDLNHRIQESKSWALPLGDTPI